MNMTNLEAHSREADSLESRLRRYGHTLDTVNYATTNTNRLSQPAAHNKEASRSQQHAKPKRKARYAMGTAVAGLSALIVSGLSFGGSSNTTIVTADAPATTRFVTPSDMTAAYLRMQAQSTMVFPVAGPASFADTFGAPRFTDTPFATRHDGVDIFTPSGSRIYSMTAGTVRLRSFDVTTNGRALNAAQGFDTRPTARQKLGSFESTPASPTYHLQFAEVTESDGTIVVYGNIEPTVADRKTVRVGQLIGLLTILPSRTPPHLHVARYSPGVRLPTSQPFVPVGSGEEYQATNIFPLLKSLQPTEGQPAALVEVQGIRVSSAIGARLKSLLDAAKAAGFTKISGQGYRSPKAQIALRKALCGTTNYDIYVKPAAQCTKPTARPGNNDHERGVAVDFSQGGRIVDAKHPFVRWLAKNAPDYGFTGLTSEPWHWSADPVLPATANPPIGTSIGTLQITSAHVNVPLIEGAASEQLKSGAGREHLSAQFGEAGETVIRCQRTAYGQPCFNLELAKIGEKIEVHTNSVVYEYTVRSSFLIDNIVTPNAISTPVVKIPSALKGKAVLTLTTHKPKYSAKQSLVVQAELSGIAFENPLYFEVGTFK